MQGGEVIYNYCFCTIKKGFYIEENKKIAIMGGNTAKIAKDDLENKLGDKVITNNNSQYIDENKSN